MIHNCIISIHWHVIPPPCRWVWDSERGNNVVTHRKTKLNPIIFMLPYQRYPRITTFILPSQPSEMPLESYWTVPLSGCHTYENKLQCHLVLSLSFIHGVGALWEVRDLTEYLYLWRGSTPDNHSFFIFCLRVRTLTMDLSLAAVDSEIARRLTLA